MEHSSRLTLRWLAAAAILLFAAPTVAQEDEGRAYFSLSSGRTYAPGESPAISLWAQNVKKLEFRLYRVSDPEKFFLNLEDDHRFGGQAPRRTSDRTLLEKIRRWKGTLRTRLRNVARAQFNQESRGAIRSWRQPERQPAAGPPPPRNLESFADVPVLNSQQLVKRWEQPIDTKDRWSSATVKIPTADKGVYMIEATDGRLQAYTIVSISETALLTKSAKGRLLGRLVRRDTGAPVSGAKFAAYANLDRDKLGEAETNSDGFAEIAVPGERIENVLVLAKSANDIAVVSTYGGNLSEESGRDLKTYVYTDRPVYRPGHTVHYRAIVRERVEKGYQLPADRNATVTVQGEDDPIHRESKTLSNMGTLEGKFEIPAKASLGYYSVEVRIGESSYQGGFHVEEYKKPEYDVRVNAVRPQVIQGQELEVTVDARYYFGEPVANAKLKWAVHKSRYWAPYRDPDDSEDSGGMDSDEDSPWVQREQTGQGAGVLDADGKTTIRFKTGEDPRDMRYRIEARVTDEAGREISGAGFVVATVGTYFLEVQGDKWVYEPGEKATFTITAKDYGGKPVANAPWRIEARLWNWRERKGRVMATATGVTGADGAGRAEVVLEGGSYNIIAESRTPESRTVTDTAYAWVSGGSGVWSSNEQRIQIVPDKKRYAPGDKAKVLVIAKPGSHLWITAEGLTVHKSYFVTAKESSATVEIPIPREFAPNFFVSAVMMSGNQLAQGSRMIRVPPVEHYLDVKLTPSKPQFKPGEPAVYNVEAKDSTGKGVEAELSVGVVDEAIYAIRPDGAADIRGFFHGTEYNRVSFDSSLNYYFQGEAGRRRMQLARMRPDRPFAQLKPDRLVQPKVRKAFPDTAFWSATVKTDSSGKAQVKFSFPDSLTTWRATARGVTADTKVGSTIGRVIVRKNLLIRLSTPRFFRQGDTMTVTAIAQNYLTTEKQVRLSLEAKGLEIVEGGARDVTVPSRGTATADFRVKVPNVDTAVLLGKALSDEESDAIEIEIPVTPFGVKHSESRSGSFGDDASAANTAIVFPSDIEPGSRKIELSVAPSVAGTVFEALDYLTAFPYGCTEQTMSSFLPNIIVSQATRELGLRSRVDENELRRKIRAGLDRLYDFQHNDGGWGWWQSDDSDTFMTAYVLAGLAQASHAGHDVDENRMSRAARWLAKSDLSKDPADLQAYAAYALAISGNTDARLLDRLFDQRANLKPYGTALLGLALHASGNNPKAEQIASSLERTARATATEASWPQEADELMRIWTDTTPESTASALKLLTALRPGSELLPKAAAYLVNHRRQGYYWNSTKQTAMVIYGLTDYMKQSGELQPDFSATVSVNGKTVLTQTFTAKDALTPATVALPASALAAGENKIEVTRSGKGRVYWSARATHYSAKVEGGGTGSRTLNVERTYYKLVPEDRGGKIVHRMDLFDGNATAGDVIAVRLRVRTGGLWRYLMIEDPIPAGAEIVQRDTLYELSEKPDWWRSYFTRKEYRDDRAVFFQTWAENGDATYVYLLKTVNPGQFRVSPARVEPMYEPDLYAVSGAQNVEVGK
ncbi:MAG: alpha-2-macroglobulin family protein [Bryobacteraceae bacterium]